jgi:hypothetical protein
MPLSMQDQIVTSSKPFMICKFWYETSTMETNQNIWTKIGNPFLYAKIVFMKIELLNLLCN